MSQKTKPMLQKFSNLLKLSIFLTKLRKPSIAKLIFLKKSRNLKRFQLLKHSNYRFLEEYQFSPSNTPMIYYHTRRFRNKRCGQGMGSVLFLCRCFGGVKGWKEEADCALAFDWDALPPITEQLPEPLDRNEEEEDSVDRRPEKFIQRFYEEMRMQKQEII
ncbi:hypothetical protein SLE2022_097020 [Rubroshorea leprosula]